MQKHNFQPMWLKFILPFPLSVSTPPIPDARIPQLLLQWVLCAFVNVFILYSEEPLIYWTFYISVKEESFVLFFSGNASLHACLGKCRNNKVKKILNSIQIPNQLPRNQLQNQMPWQIVGYQGEESPKINADPTWTNQFSPIFALPSIAILIGHIM